MTTTSLSPTAVFKGWANDGTPLAYGLLNTYAAGSTTPIATYTDSTGATPNANPVVLNARGECNLWLLPNTAYKLVLTDSSGNIIWTVDQIINIALLTLYGGVDSGSVNAYVLNFAAPYSSLVNGIVIYWTPSNTNTGPSTLNVNGLGAVPIINQSGSALGGGQIIGGQVASVIYYNGNWLLTSSVGSLQQMGTFLGTLTGFTTTVTATFQYRVYNNVVYLFFNTTNPTGISNSTSMTLTGLPAALFPLSQRAIICCSEDNGNVEQLSLLTITNTGACTFYKYQPLTTGDFSSVGYTASGAKGLPSDWSASYPLS